ncbi:hypothetical protein, partial [Methanocorpusculum vombati]
VGASRAFAVALATATPPAQLWAGWRATKSKCDERSSAVRRICEISRFLSASCPLTTNSSTMS